MDIRLNNALYYVTLILTVMSALFYTETDSTTTQLAANNMDSILAENEIVFVNFYADWCRFSQMLAPIFEESATKVTQEFPQPGKVVFGKVDCDKENSMAAKYHVSKYPTLKMFKNGVMQKREYRGQRSADAIASYIREQAQDPVKVIDNLDDADNNMDRNKRNIIGYFDNEMSSDLDTMRKVAGILKDDCVFHSAVGPVSENERIAGNKLVFRPKEEDASDVPFHGMMTDYNLMLAWATDKCVPLVRQITFENAEELTEEGLPFVILFTNPDDKETPEMYNRIVSKELIGEKSGVNFLTADGNKFSHPLFHLGKSTQDLPILAIDSFRHMYLWPHNPTEYLETPGLLKQFIADLHSGKLHREFHQGPDPTAPQIGQDDSSHMPKDTDDTPKPAGDSTTPPESTFAKLGPSRSRYTLLNRDEL